MNYIKNINGQELAASSIKIENTAKKSATNGLKTAEDAAKEFEALLLKQMLSEMWQAIPKEGVLEGGRAEEMYYDMFHESVADSIAENGGIGIKDELLEDMKRQEKKGK